MRANLIAALRGTAIVTDENDKSSIDEYLERARSLWEEHNEPPDRERLRHLALAVDMSDAESEQADHRSRKLTERAGELLKRGDDNAALPLLRDALLLSPVRVQPAYLLARIYADQYGTTGDSEDHRRAKQLGSFAQDIDPTHGPTRSLLEQIGTNPQHGLPWRKAALIVLVIIAISATLQLCHRYVLTPEVTEEQTQEVRDHLEENRAPPGEK